MEQAGLGLQSFNISGCSLGYTAGDGGAVSLAALAPVTINPAASVIPAGDANTDTLLVTDLRGAKLWIRYVYTLISGTGATLAQAVVLGGYQTMPASDY